MMQQSDTTIAQMAGLGIERRTLPPESREAHALLERRHALEWRNTTAARFDSPLLPWLRNAHARWRLARMQSLRREDDVAVAILRKQGLPLEPPREKR
jgi:ligand-binding sensor domain-containing protein